MSSNLHLADASTAMPYVLSYCLWNLKMWLRSITAQRWLSHVTVCHVPYSNWRRWTSAKWQTLLLKDLTFRQM